jgi:hypothetical protein
VVASAVGEADEIEPEQRHPLAVVRRREQPVDRLLIAAGGVLEELVDVGDRRRQAVRSKLRRRNSVTGSASGDGCRPSFSSRARMNASTGFRIHFAFFATGGAPRCGGMKAQWPCHSAPCSIHFFRIAASRGVSFLPDLAGGIFSSRSVEVTRFQSRLLARLRGATATLPSSSVAKMPSFVSKRSLASRALGSGPWHL